LPGNLTKSCESEQGQQSGSHEDLLFGYLTKEIITE
jgi:hypothetical protein